MTTESDNLWQIGHKFAVASVAPIVRHARRMVYVAIDRRQIERIKQRAVVEEMATIAVYGRAWSDR